MKAISSPLGSEKIAKGDDGLPHGCSFSPSQPEGQLAQSKKPLSSQTDSIDLNLADQGEVVELIESC